MSKKKTASKDVVVLSTGVRVSKMFHDELFEKTMANIRTLRYGVPYKSEDIVEPRYWAKHRFDHWHMGCCIADWERRGLIPLRFVGCEYCKVRYYMRT